MDTATPFSETKASTTSSTGWRRTLSRTLALPREYALFLVATTLVAVHVADDNFLQPQPGTSARDHLVSGLVPLGLFALVAWAYPRRRAGLRASVALVFGSFGIVAGFEAVHYWRQGALSGDDYTGLLSIPAGILLIVVGASALWRSRRLDDRKRWRYPRRLLIAAASVAFTFFVLMGVLVSYAFTHMHRVGVPAAKLGTAYEEVSFKTSDGLTLKGWYIPSKNGAAIIAFPGRKGPQTQARMLAKHGYGVLLYDRRGEGESDGDPNVLGWSGDEDVKAGAAFLRSRADVDPERIGGIGLSVGGENLLEAAAEADAIKAVVSEGAGIRSAREASELGASRLIEIAIFAEVTAPMAVFYNHAPPPNLKEVVGRIAPRPVFLIYATKGQGGEELNGEFYAAASEPKSLWKTNGGHTDGINAEPVEYERRVIGFFDDALLDR